MSCKPCAVFTIAQDEPFFLGKWLTHYAIQGFDPRDTYVLRHLLPNRDAGADDAWRREINYATACGVNVVEVHREESFNHLWLRTTVSAFQAFLLQSYKWVLFAEADEFVIQNSDHASYVPVSSLHDAIVAFGDDAPEALRTKGYEVVHDRLREPNYADNSGALLKNRNQWYHSRIYSKTTLARTPLVWDSGFHNVENRPDLRDLPIDDRFFLVHLHKFDFVRSLAKSQKSAQRNWSKVDYEINHGFQNRLTNGEQTATYFDVNVDNNQPFTPGQLVPIPEWLKEVI